MVAKETYFCMLGHYTGSRRAYRIFSTDDDAGEALDAARRMQSGCRLAHAYCDEGAIVTNPPRHDEPLEPGKVLPGRRRMRRTKCP